ncbi:MAG: DUF460 domain-containing protein [Nanoarchaeota archaeon]|nr:DUF460 domain-containing protein [Nanoarchaeota archaeon]
MSRAPIIIGIDPGTTSAYAILDIDKTVIDIGSAKEIGLSGLIKQIVRNGFPVVVGTDKAKVPDLIGKFAAKTGCKIAAPEYDLKVGEKKLLIKNYIFRNTHEMDALASALYAYNYYTDLIKRIMKYVKVNSKEQITNELIIYVIRRGLPIKDAAQLIEGKDEETKVVRKVIEEKDTRKKDFVGLYNKFKRLEKDNLFLKGQNAALANGNNELKQELAGLDKLLNKKSVIKSRKIDALFSFKEQRARELEKRLRENEKEISELRKEIKKAHSFISRLNRCYLLKKLNNLGIREFEGKKEGLNISKGDILLVGNVNIYNRDVLKLMEDKINVIIYEEKPNEKTRDELKFELISSKDLFVEEFGSYALVEKRQLDKGLQKKNILNKIIREYKESRK